MSVATPTIGITALLTTNLAMFTPQAILLHLWGVLSAPFVALSNTLTAHAITLHAILTSDPPWLVSANHFLVSSPAWVTVRTHLVPVGAAARGLVQQIVLRLP